MVLNKNVILRYNMYSHALNIVIIYKLMPDEEIITCVIDSLHVKILRNMIRWLAVKGISERMES